MAKTFISRHDMEALADRLDAKAWSNLFLDMPETRRDLRLAAAILRWLVSMGIPSAIFLVWLVILGRYS